MLPVSSAFEVMTLWRYTNLFTIIISSALNGINKSTD